MTKTFVSVFAVAALAGSALAAKPVESLSTKSFSSGAYGARDTTLISTGFEGPAWVPGSAEPQNGWSSSGVNLPWQQISTANPFAGSQHLRMTNDASVGLGTQRLVFSPSFAIQPAQSTTTTMQLAISNDQGADYDVIGQAPSQALLTWRIRFSFSDSTGTGPGTIFILDDDGEGNLFFNPITTWTPGGYKELKVVTNPGTSTIDYYYGGAFLYTSAMFAGTTVEQLVWRTDNFQLAGETADVDNVNLTIVPGPGALALMGLGGLAASRRRRA